MARYINGEAPMARPKKARRAFDQRSCCVISAISTEGAICARDAYPKGLRPKKARRAYRTFGAYSAIGARDACPRNYRIYVFYNTYIFYMSLPTSTWGLEADANRIKKTYVKGYMDVSGGELSVHNTAFNVFNSAGDGTFRVDPQKITVKDDIGQIIDISLSYLTFLNNLVPADGQAVSIPDKVKYIFTSGTETRIGKPDASSNFRVYGNTYVEQFLFVEMDASFGQNVDISGSLNVQTHLKLPVGGNNERPTTINEALSAGYIRYNSDNSQFEGYGPGDSWGSLGGVINVSQNTKIIASSPDPDSLNNELQFFTAPTGSTLVGDTKERMRILANGDVSMNERLLVGRDASLNGNLYIASRTRMGGDLSLNGNFAMYGGDASLNRNLLVGRDASLNGNLYVLSKSRFGGDLSLNGNFSMYGGDASLNGLLLVGRDASLNGNLFVASRTRLGGDLSLNGNLFVYSGDASLNRNLLVGLDASLNGNLYVASRTRLNGHLDVSGTINATGASGTLLRLQNTSGYTVSGNTHIDFWNSHSTPSNTGRISSMDLTPDIYSTWITALSFNVRYHTENLVEGMRITGETATTTKTYFNGNVGIGKTNPTYNLDVSGIFGITSGTADTKPSLTIIKNTGNAANFAGQWQHRAQLQIQDVLGNSLVLGMSTDGVGIIQGKKENASDYRHISINPASVQGNVGIGTINPSYKLDVNGTIFGNTFSSTNFTISSSSVDSIFESKSGTTGKMYFRSSGATNNKGIQIDNNTGNVGIKGDSDATYALNVNGTVQATSYNATSDYRVKTDIKPLDSSFNVDGLKPVTYTNTRHGRQDVGFIAHEIQEHFPFLVNGEKDGEHMQSLNYIGLIGILTKEIQDLKKRLAETDAKIASLETNVGEVGSKIEDVDIKIISIGKDIDGVETRFDDVETKVASFETRFDDVETKVVLEQARLSICETGVAFNKSAIDDINRRFQS